jgi:hypothetical protein
MDQRADLGVRAIASPEAWAQQTFGSVDVGDARRTRRLVRMATGMARDPAQSLPQQAGAASALKGAYRLLDTDAVTFATLLAPHLEQTRARATNGALTLLVQDTTELDFTGHRATQGLGPIGNGGGRGFHLQTVLAVQPRPRQVLGVLAAEPWLRVPAPSPQETSAQRAKRPRESDVWGRLVEASGRPGEASRWVHVADRGADCYGFFTACAATGQDVLVRVTQNRRMLDAAGEADHLVDHLRACPIQATHPLRVAARAKQPARETTVAVGWAPLCPQPPQHGARGVAKPPALHAWGIRVWEPDPPPAGCEAIDWLLLTTVAVETAEDAWERVEWYTCRWIIEEFHQCLKTGCRAEMTQLRECDKLWRHLAILLPLAVRLLGLRDLARTEPDVPVAQVIDAVTVRVVAIRTNRPPARTTGEFLRQVAQLGGHQGRRGDGPPGWRSLWTGWRAVQLLVEGVSLAAQVREPQRSG